MANSLNSISATNGASWSLDRFVYPLALLAHTPMLAEWAKNMWRKEHYQFFPLLLAFVAWRLVEAWRDGGGNKKERVKVGEGVEGGRREAGFVEGKAGEGDAGFAERNATVNCAGFSERNATVNHAGFAERNATKATGLLVANLLLLSASALAFSPFLIVPALMLLIASAFVAHQGWSGFRRVMPTWSLLLFIVPLPLNWDAQLVQNMQFLASQLASAILDAFGQIHFRQGVVLATHSNNFLAEEACSGVRSLFSSLTVIAIYGVLNQYSLRRHLFNLAQTVLWVIAGNAIRIAIIILVADHWTMAIASGPAHEAFGLVVFLLIFALALSTDRLLDLQPDKESLEWSS